MPVNRFCKRFLRGLGSKRQLVVVDVGFHEKCHWAHSKNVLGKNTAPAAVRSPTEAVLSTLKDLATIIQRFEVLLNKAIGFRHLFRRSVDRPKGRESQFTQR